MFGRAEHGLFKLDVDLGLDVLAARWALRFFILASVRGALAAESASEEALKNIRKAVEIIGIEALSGKSTPKACPPNPASALPN